MEKHILPLINPVFSYSVYNSTFFNLLIQSLSVPFSHSVVTGATDGIGKAYAEEVRFLGLRTFLDF